MEVAIQITNLVKKYDNNIIFDKLNLTIIKGKMVVITGPSGSGKSTLLNIIGLLEEPTSGDVTILGEKNIKVNSMKGTRFLRNHIGYLFQNYALIDNESVEENLLIALKYKKNINKKEEIALALSKVGLKGFEKRKIYSLSGGEQQRVAIARLLLKPCEIILADEPTGNLDPENKEKVIKLLKNFKKSGKTVIVVTHDPSILGEFDEEISLEKLKIK